jgi:hypothetical protein
MIDVNLALGPASEVRTSSPQPRSPNPAATAARILENSVRELRISKEEAAMEGTAMYPCFSKNLMIRIAVRSK